MNEQIRFTLPGPPPVKGRPRFGRGVTFTDAKTRAAEQSVLAAYLMACGSARTPHPGPVMLVVTATFAVPASWPKWKRELALAGRYAHCSRPDLDNIIKAVLDGLNGIAFVDDSQVAHIASYKRFDATAQTYVALTFLDHPTREGAGG